MTVFRVLIISAMLGFVTTRTILRDKFLLEQCPSSCTCNIVEKMVDCSNANFSEIPSEIDTNVTSLDLSFNKFSGIPMGIVNLPQLLDLDLSNNPMIRLIEINFQSTSLRSLKLRRCSIDYIDNSVFKGLPNLEVLNLSENPLNYLNNSLVSSSVKSLDLSNCNLKHLKALSFSGMTSLAYLSLKNNHNLRLLHSDSDSLLTLDVSNCNLEHVPTGPLRKIVELDLHGNNIQWLRNRTFSNITNVENLNISYNAIKQIEVNSFSHLSYLTIIDLSYNRLATIEKIHLKEMKDLNTFIYPTIIFV
ncbi:hypothetical protein HHI36_023192 [Cryptolaemus montrouzieri]|uniref:LRRNT domain-containing protein n=1 Tax=Cryptolaemus montrouzieri TaxID=559131 RepID=A0ABD2PFV9_9CUCU